MYFRAIAGLVAGLCAGVVSGIMFLLMRVPQYDGLAYSVLTVISRAIGSNDPSVGWSYHLFNAAMVGVIFAIVMGKWVHNFFVAIGLGLFASLASWIFAGLVLWPKIAEPGWAFTDLATSPLGVASFIGYAVQGILLGAIYLWVYNPIRLDEESHRPGQQTENSPPLAAGRSDSARRPGQPSR